MREARGRLTLHLWAQGYATRQAIVAGPRRPLPGHGDRCPRQAQGAWSFPLKQRTRLLAWFALWFDGAAIARRATQAACAEWP